MRRPLNRRCTTPWDPACSRGGCRDGRQGQGTLVRPLEPVCRNGHARLGPRQAFLFSQDHYTPYMNHT